MKKLAHMEASHLTPMLTFEFRYIKFLISQHL